MVLLIRHPPAREPERRYAIDLVLREFLGLEYRAITEDRSDTCITIGDERDDRRLTLPESLFGVSDDVWLTDRSLPGSPLQQWPVPTDLLDRSERLGSVVPALYSSAESWSQFTLQTDRLEVPIDLFAGVFFRLTRYEELVRTERDAWDRFHSELSLLSREGLSPSDRL